MEPVPILKGQKKSEIRTRGYVDDDGPTHGPTGRDNNCGVGSVADFPLGLATSLWGFFAKGPSRVLALLLGTETPCLKRLDPPATFLVQVSLDFGPGWLASPTLAPFK